VTAFIRTVLGDIEDFDGIAYAHEHLIIDSPLIADRFAHIHLYDVEAAVEEVTHCRDAGVGLMVDTMTVAAGRDIVRLAEISRRTGVHILSVTGLHHDRYYGPLHWTNRVSGDELTELFIAELTTGVDEFDYTSPIIRRTTYRAGLAKVATSGANPDARDLRNIDAVAHASAATGAPVLTHCEGGFGGIAQVERLVSAGVPATSIILSHTDKTKDLYYLRELAQAGAVLELDQSIKGRSEGTESFTARAIVHLIEAGLEDQIVLGTDGARRSIWSSLGGEPGLAWLASAFPTVLTQMGVEQEQMDKIQHSNALRALTWRSLQ